MTIINYIIDILFLLVESFFITSLVTSLIDLINKNHIKRIKSFVILWALIFDSLLINNIAYSLFESQLMGFKTFIFILFITIGCHLLYKIKLFKAVIVTIMCALLLAITQLIVVHILNKLNINNETIINSTLKSSILACIIAATSALIALCLNYIKHSIKIAHNKLKCFIPNFIAIVICLLPAIILLALNNKEHSIVFNVINIIHIIIIILIGVVSIKFVAKNEETKLLLDNTTTHNKTLKKINEGIRGFKHDLGNIVQALLGYVAINDTEGAKEYCKNLVIGFNDINSLSVLSPKVIDDPAIYGIVANKILSAREKNMSLSLDVSTSVSEINFPKFELSRTLGILLDNAIEASEQTDDKKLIVNIRHDFTLNTDIIVISNSINDTNIDLEKIFTKNYSTKEKPSGFGLYELTKFIKKNPQSNISTSINPNLKLLTQTLVINR